MLKVLLAICLSLGGVVINAHGSSINSVALLVTGNFLIFLGGYITSYIFHHEFSDML